MTTVPNVTSRRVEKRRKCMNSVKKTQDHRLDPQPPRLYKMFVRFRTPVPPFSVVDRQKSPFHYEINSNSPSIRNQFGSTIRTHLQKGRLLPPFRVRLSRVPMWFRTKETETSQISSTRPEGYRDSQNRYFYTKKSL